jgi:hypothetical protein
MKVIICGDCGAVVGLESGSCPGCGAEVAPDGTAKKPAGLRPWKVYIALACAVLAVSVTLTEIAATRAWERTYVDPITRQEMNESNVTGALISGTVWAAVLAGVGGLLLGVAIDVYRQRRADRLASQEWRKTNREQP